MSKVAPITLFRILIIVLVVGVRLLFRLDLNSVLGNGLLVIGWLVGYLWADGEKYMRKWLPASENSPIKNIFTALVIAVLGVWVVTSSGSVLASGVVVGLGIKLFSDYLIDADRNKWYWLIARPLTTLEKNIVLWIWTALLIWQLLTLLRG